MTYLAFSDKDHAEDFERYLKSGSGHAFRGDREVRITIPDLGELHDKTPVLVEDIVSSGRTMLETAKLLREKGLPPPVCIAVHALLADDAYRALLKIANIVASTNTVPHQSNRRRFQYPE